MDRQGIQGGMIPPLEALQERLSQRLNDAVQTFSVEVDALKGQIAVLRADMEVLSGAYERTVATLNGEGEIQKRVNALCTQAHKDPYEAGFKPFR